MRLSHGYQIHTASISLVAAGGGRTDEDEETCNRFLRKLGTLWSVALCERPFHMLTKTDVAII